MKRTVAYIDGYNLYYGILKGTPHKEARGSDPSVYVLLYMLDCVAAASFNIKPTYADDEDVVAT